MLRPTPLLLLLLATSANLFPLRDRYGDTAKRGPVRHNKTVGSVKREILIGTREQYRAVCAEDAVNGEICLNFPFTIANFLVSRTFPFVFAPARYIAAALYQIRYRIRVFGKCTIRPRNKQKAHIRHARNRNVGRNPPVINLKTVLSM